CQAGGLGVIACTVRCILSKLCIDTDDSNCFGFWLLRGREFKESSREFPLRIGTERYHGKVVFIVRFAVGGSAENADRRQVARRNNGKGRADLIGDVWPEQQVDLIDIEQLRINVVLV